jgi:hypothetical protein
LGLARVELCELGQGIFKRQQVYVAIRLDDQVLVKRDAMPIATPLCCAMSSSMIHENLSHSFSGNGQEMGPALPINACLTDELEVGFVNQRGRLKSMALSFPVQVSRGKCSQFGVDVHEQLLFGKAVPWFELLQELSDPRRSARFHGRPTHQSLRSMHDGIVVSATGQVKVDDGRQSEPGFPSSANIPANQRNRNLLDSTRIAEIVSQPSVSWINA